MRALGASALILVAGCGLDLTAVQPWVRIDNQVALDDAGGAALYAESASATPSPFRSRNPVSVAPIRVVTYNVQYGEDVVGLAAAISETPALASAGVILLQEVESYPAEGSSRAARIAERLGLGYVYVPARAVRGGGTHGLAILSAFPIVNVERMLLPDAGKGRTRIAIQADLEIGGQLLHIIDLHLDTKLNTKERIAHLRPAVIDAPQATLVAGDFNTCWVEWVGGTIPVLSSGGSTDQADVIDSYMRALAFDTPTAGSGPTEQMLGLEQRLDSIYTRDLAVTFGGVERVGPSDHWPMWVDLHLAP